MHRLVFALSLLVWVADIYWLLTYRPECVALWIVITIIFGPPILKLVAEDFWREYGPKTR